MRFSRIFVWKLIAKPWSVVIIMIVLSLYIILPHLLQVHPISVTYVVKPPELVNIPDSNDHRLTDGLNSSFPVDNVILPQEFTYPLNIDMPGLVQQILDNKTIDPSIQPVNNFWFPILIDQPDRCRSPDNWQRIDLLVLIKSKLSNRAQRDAIRQTWGNERCWGGRNVVRLFLLGSPGPGDPPGLADRIHHEAKVYHDLVQSSFVDSYYNNTYKLMLGLEWAWRYCSTNGKLLTLFVDDDFFVQPRNVVAFVESLSDAYRQRLVGGFLWRMALPIRSSESKHLQRWIVEWKDYPNKHYPPYLAAGCFFIAMPVIAEVIIAARYTKYLPFDDVFLGIVLNKLLRTPTHVHRIYAFSNADQTREVEVRSMLSTHGQGTPTDQLKLWKRLNCSQFCVSGREHPINL